MRALAILMLVLVVGCSPLSAPASPPSATMEPAASPTAFAIAVPSAPATAASQTPAVPASPVPVRAVAATTTPSTSTAPKTEPSVPVLTLQVDSPKDESIVASPLLLVSGRTAPDAVVSVNDKLAEVSLTGAFQLTVTLNEGPNILEIVASDINGNEMSSIVSVIYDPSQQAK